jgi:hypothetical protein
MKYRKLRIAWSVAWGVVAVLSILLWIRSNWYQDGWNYQSGTERCYIRSEVGFLKWARSTPYYMQDHPWRWQTMKASLSNSEPTFVPTYRVWGKYYQWVVPYLFTTPFAFILGGLPWAGYLRLPSRFSLRTLLIATTLVAVGLGLITWLM